MDKATNLPYIMQTKSLHKDFVSGDTIIHAVNGTSQTGEFTDFQQKNTDTFEDGYVFKATPKFLEDKTSFSLSIERESGTSKGNAVSKEGGVTTVRLLGAPLAIMQRLNIEKQIAWACGYSKAVFSDSSAEETKLINNSSPAIDKKKSFSLTCEIRIGTLAFKASSSIYLVVGSLE
ncbi:MAG: hypothetical protein SPJ80_04660 [Bacilli bacterium]|nr:hypothetical protein [Bacilli bacterium]